MSQLTDAEKARIAAAYARLPKNGKSGRVPPGEARNLARHFGVSVPYVVKLGRAKQ